MCVHSLFANHNSDTLREVLVQGKKWTDHHTSLISYSLNENQKASNSAFESFRNHYGANFTAQGVSGIISPRLRGTNPEHTALVWNGINVNHAGLGQSNGFLIPNNQFANYQLLPGGNSVNFGSGAIGGALIIDDELQFNNSNQLTIEGGLGSFGRYSLNSQYRYSNERTSIKVSAYHLEQENDFEYRNYADFRRQMEKQQNASFYQDGVNLSIASKLGSNAIVGYNSWIHDAYTEVQPTISAGNQRNLQLDHTQKHRLFYQQIFGSYFTESELYFTSDDIRYNSSYSGINRYGVKWRLSRRFNKFYRIELGMQNDYFQPNLRNYAEDSEENRFRVFAMQEFSHGNFDARLNLSQAIIDSYEVPVTGNFNLSYKLIDQENLRLSLSGTASKDFRVPTLNERYWTPGGNPDIKAEKSRQFELGINSRFKNLRISSSIYNLQVKDAVQWLAFDSVWSQQESQWYYGNIFSPVNVNSLRSRGFNLRIGLEHLHVNEFIINSNLSYDRTIARDERSSEQRFYIPENTAAYNLDIQFRRTSFSANYLFVSEQRTLSNILSAYDLLNLGVSQKFKFGSHDFLVSVYLNNALNETYQTFIHRAMPGRNYLIKLNYNVNFKKSS